MIEKVYCICVMILGNVLFGYSMSKLSEIFHSSDQISQEKKYFSKKKIIV